MDSNFAADGAVGGLETQKAFQIGRNANEDRAIEPRHRYSHAKLPYVAKMDVRTYVSGFQGGPADSIAPQVGNFWSLPDKWTYYWFFVDIDKGFVSYWVGDEGREAVKILDRAAWSRPVGAWNQFWFEFNSSQRREGPPASAWGRNAVVLKDIDINQATSLVSKRYE